MLNGHLYLNDRRPFSDTISYFDELFREVAATFVVYRGDVTVDLLSRWYSKSRQSDVGGLLESLQPNELAEIQNNYDALLDPIILRLHLAFKSHTPDVRPTLDGMLLLNKYREQIEDDNPAHFFVYEHLQQLPLRRPGQHASEKEARKIIQAYEKYDGVVSHASKRLKLTPQALKSAWIYAGLFPKDRDADEDAIVQEYRQSGGVVAHAARRLPHSAPTIRRVWRKRGLQPVDGRSKQARRWKSRNA
jgi:hypothetical protein